MWVPYIVESTSSDNTSDIYNMIVFDTRRYKRINLMIGNIGNNSLTLIVQVKAMANGVLINTDIPTMILTPGSTLRYLNDKLLAEVDLLIKSTNPGQSTKYLLESIKEQID